MNCPICNSPSKKLFLANDFISKDEFSICVCDQCGVGFTFPQPTDINRYYPQDYRHFAKFTRWFLQLLYRRQVKKWVKKIGFTGNALEVGCGNGWMLNALSEQGWKVVGYERNNEQATRVTAETGHEVRSGDLSLIKDEKFDLILLFNVLEHLSDPVTALQQCSQLLTEQGVLIINTPNLDSWQAKFSKAYWAHLDVPRHLFHFSEKSYVYILKQAGMKITQISTVSWIHDPYGWVVGFLNKMGFAHNRLTDELMKRNFAGFLNPSGLLLMLVSALLVPVSLILAPISWVFKRGALIEVWAVKVSQK